MLATPFEALAGDDPAALTAAAPRPKALRAEAITDRAGFDALASEWRALEARATGAVLFQSYAWCAAAFARTRRRIRPSGRSSSQKRRRRIAR